MTVLVGYYKMQFFEAYIQSQDFSERFDNEDDFIFVNFCEYFYHVVVLTF